MTMVIPLCLEHKQSHKMLEFIECCNVVELGEDDDDIRNIKILELEGEHEINVPKL